MAAKKKAAKTKAKAKTKAAAKKSAAKKKTVASKAAPKKKAPVKKAVQKDKSVVKKAAPPKVVSNKTVGKAKPKKAKTERQPAPPSTSSHAGPVPGIAPYIEKRGEEYMNEAQTKHFRQILLAWKRELMEEVDRTVHHMQDEAANFPDPNDRATQESDFSMELRTRDRERKLLSKIDEALERIEDGSYGFCEETGEPISLKRLDARPIATLSIEAQERHERREKVYRDE